MIMRMPQLRASSLVVTAVVVLTAVLAAAAPAAAAIVDPSIGPHDGNVGVHTLLDGYESPTTCKYGTNHVIRKIQVQEPIVFAYNRTDHTDSQKVGWRYTIEYQNAIAAATGYDDWPDLYKSPFIKASASDLVNAHFDPQVYTFSGDPTDHYVYRVAITLRWYYPTNSRVDGSGVHAVRYYFQKDPMRGDMITIDGCNATSVPPMATSASGASPAGIIVIDPTFGPHSGDYGTHKLIDSIEFPTVCKYSGSTHDLKKIQVRRPILFGDDRTNHLDMQKVGWRYRIEYVDSAAAGEPYQDLPDLYVSPVMKANATDEDNANFRPQTYTFSNPPAHDWYRVSIQMIWYYPGNSHVDGKAVHAHYFYRTSDPIYGDNLALQYCPRTTLAG